MGKKQEEQLNKMKLRQSYSNLWHVDLLGTFPADPLYCCFALWCGPCASYLLRKRALYGDMRRYKCCGGFMPCSGKCGEEKCPEFCLCTEVWCCFSNSVSSTRFMLQDEFNIQTTKCDNCIIGFMIFLQQLSCICSIIACLSGDDDLEDLAECLKCLADMAFLTVCPCIQTQHKIEMDKRDGLFDQMEVMGAPPVQQMSRIDQRVPSPAGGYPSEPVMYSYPPHTPQGYPPHTPQGYPPHQPQGYSPHQPPGYPPHQPQGYPHSPVYPPPQPSHSPQVQGYPPPVSAPSHPVYPPPAEGYPPPASSPSHPVYPPPAQGHPPPGSAPSHSAYPPPAEGHPPPSLAPPHSGHPQ